MVKSACLIWTVGASDPVAMWASGNLNGPWEVIKPEIKSLALLRCVGVQLTHSTFYTITLLLYAFLSLSRLANANFMHTSF